MKTLQAIVVVGSLAGLSSAGWAQQSRVSLVDDTRNSEFVITIGPVDLPVPQGGHGDHGGHDAGGMEPAHAPMFPPLDEVELPRAAYLHGFSYRVLDGRGRELPVEVLHHLNLIMPSRRELFLPISHRLLAVGKETGTQEVPGGVLGVPVRRAERVVVAAMLHNPTGQAHVGVTVEVRLKYSTERPEFVVYPFQMDIGFPAGDKDVDLPPGRSVFAWEGSPAVPGKIVVVGGHLHEYAARIALMDVAAGDTLWDGVPTFDAEGNVTGVTVDVFDDESAITLDASRTYRVVAIYDNPTGASVPSGGMGVVGGVFLPDDDVEWPEADPNHRLYRIDRMHYMRKVRARFAEIEEMIERGELSPDGRNHDSGQKDDS